MNHRFNTEHRLRLIEMKWNKPRNLITVGRSRFEDWDYTLVGINQSRKKKKKKKMERREEKRETFMIIISLL